MAGEVEKFMELEKKHKEVETIKIRVDEQLNAKKKALADLLKEIKAAGFDPATLKQDTAKKEAEVKEELLKFERDLNEASMKLSHTEV